MNKACPSYPGKGAIRLDPEAKPAVNASGLPSGLRPSPDTLEALGEVEDMKNHPEAYQGYNDVHRMFTEILNEED